jgi:hypothetical protein
VFRHVRIVGREAVGCARALRLDAVAPVVALLAVVSLVPFTMARHKRADDSTPPAARPVPAAPTTASPLHYVFEATAGGAPIGFDQCDSLSIRYQRDGEPYAAAEDVSQAVALLAAAMARPVGFQMGGSTDGPTITVSWVRSPMELPGSPDRDTVGTGGFSSEDGVAVAGTVTLAASGTLKPGFGAHSWGAVYLHELGHAVGLGHVDDPNEEMYPTVIAARPAGYGVGDLAGLARLGGPCRKAN